MKFSKCIASFATLALSLKQVDAAANVLEAASEAGLVSLQAAINAAGVGSVLETFQGTLFAPSEDAFNALGTETFGLLAKSYNRDLLTKVLTYHLVPTPIDKDTFVALPDGTQVTTLADLELTKSGVADLIDLFGQTVTVSGATNTGVDNGAFVHIVDNVLLPFATLPPLDVVQLALEKNLENLVEAVIAAGLDTALAEADGITVFAPKDSKLDGIADDIDSATLGEILKYHVVPQVLTAETIIAEAPKVYNTLGGGSIVSRVSSNGKVFINDIQVVATDARAFNGIVHTIEDVLAIPPADIIAAVANNDDFEYLVHAVTSASLVNTVQSFTGTLIAPDDRAFKRLGSATLGALLRTYNQDLLQAVLSYHLIPDAVSGDAFCDLPKGTPIATVLGVDVTKNSKASVRDAKGQIVFVKEKSNIPLLNGAYIHRSNKVLVPFEQLPKHFIWQTVLLAKRWRLVTAVLKARLLGTLSKRDTGITLFAPVESALVGVVRSNSRSTLRKVLKYHTVEGLLSAATIIAEAPATYVTLEGGSISTTSTADGVFVNGVKVVQTDERAFNGYVHSIEGILPFQ